MRKSKKKYVHPLMKAMAGKSFTDYGDPENPFDKAKTLDSVEVVAKILGAPKYSKPIGAVPDAINRLGAGLPDIATSTDSNYIDTDPALKPYTKMPRSYQTPAESLGDVVLNPNGEEQLTEEQRKRKGINWGQAAMYGLLGIDALLPGDKIHNPVVQPGEGYNPHRYGTGSQAISKSGIHIKKSKRGTLHDAVGVDRDKKIPASKLAIKESDSPALKKKKQFAKNAKKWKHESGGPIAYNPNLAAKDKAFQAWYTANTLEGKNGVPYGENLDYDYYSFFRNKGQGNIQDHFPDTYKRPTHPTFSNESIYSIPENPGGKWEGDKFIPHMKSGGKLSKWKAKEMLKDGTANGKKLTKKQKRYFGMVAAGKADAGMAVGDPVDPKKRLAQDVNTGNTYRDPYYEASARLAHYKGVLNQQLQKKNPNGYKSYFSGMMASMLDPNVKNPAQARREYVQNTPYNDYLSPDEVAKTLGKEDYDSYLSSLEEVNKYNVSQGLEPLYGTVEGEKDVRQLNYGRRFASLQMTPSVSSTVKGANGENRTYKRNYQYDPTTRSVNYTEEGDLTAVPKFLKPKTNPLAKMDAGGKFDDISTLHNYFTNHLTKTNKNSKMAGGGSLKRLSHNPVDGGTTEFVGPSHANGGIDVQYGNTNVEVEGGEPATMSPDGTLNIMGNMVLPGTKTKFKTVSKNIAKKENIYTHLMNKGSELVNNADPMKKDDVLSFNSGKLMMTGGKLGNEDLARKKEMLAQIQNDLLTVADEQGLDPIAMSEGKKKKAKYGAKLKAAGGGSVDPVKDALEKAAAKYGVRPSTIKKLVGVESGGSTRAKSNVGALGVMQFMPETAKGYGITEKQLTSSDPKDIEAVVDAGVKHFKSLMDKNGGDEKLALAAYNGGQGAVDFVKKQLGKKQITGDEWVNFMQKRNETNPTDKASAWQNQTLDYVTAISGGDPALMKQVGDKYYDMGQVDGVLPDVTKSVYGLPKEGLKIKPPTPVVPNNPDPEALGHVQVPEDRALESNAEGLDWKQIVPELFALGNNKEKGVFMQSYTPDLYTPYKVSAQDQLNENTDTFNALQRQAGNNPTALAVLAAQKYSADANALGNTFKINQGIENDVTNKNVSLLNDAKIKNLGLADTQYTRQSTAASKTKAQNQLIVNSIAGKYLQNEANNRKLSIYENLYDYRFRDKNNDGYASEAQYEGANAQFSYKTAPTEGLPDASVTVEKDAQGNVKKTRIRTPTAAQAEGQQLRNQKLRNEMPLLRNFNLFGRRNNRSR